MLVYSADWGYTLSARKIAQATTFLQLFGRMNRENRGRDIRHLFADLGIVVHLAYDLFFFYRIAYFVWET
jgi:hypothetical protein